MADKPDNQVVMALIGRAQGLKGEVRATSYTEDPLALGDYGPLLDASGKAFTVKSIRAVGATGNQVVLKLNGIDDRTAAEALNGMLLMLPRDRLPQLDDADDFYHADLIGLNAIGTDGAVLGRVNALHDFGAGDMVEIMLATGRSVLVPFTKAAVPIVSVAAGHITIDPDAAGLGADDDDEDGTPAEPS